MAIRLVKIASELNVGTNRIVEFLNGNGFSIDNKPTAKVTEEMYNALIKEFSKSMQTKEKADQLVLGNQKELHKKIETKNALFQVKKVEEKVPEKIEALTTPDEDPKTSENTPPKVEKLSSKPEESTGLKVIGKIDLDAAKKPKKKKEEAQKKEEAKKETKKLEAIPPKEEKVEENDGEPAKGAAENPQEEVLVRAKTPQLQGLKVLGKIDKSRLDIINKKPKKEEKPKQVTDKNKGTEEGRKRKRTRKKVSASAYNGGQNRRGGNNIRNKKPKNDEVKEVSQKEIDEKIKATMARLSAGGKRKRQKIRRDNRAEKQEKQEQKELEAQETVLKVTEFISVSELASVLNVSVTEVITTCMNLGVIVSINQRLDAEIIELVASEFNTEVQFIGNDDQEEEEEIIEDDPADLIPRGPIVTVMGHVDHGKTSLLDQIRDANVADGEAGGITQHIGAYSVKLQDSDAKVTFLDTPGHEAFTAMRARGAKVTDIAIIIIAADDKIMPQTKEAISHAQAAGVPMIFAINKIDKDGANPERIKQELASMNLLIEEWGGKYQSQDISAKTGLNIDKLLEKIVLEAEVLELKANPVRQANGTVLEASLDKGKGYVTKILVQNGTLKIGDSMVAGGHSGKVKAMFNEKGKRVKIASPSTPVAVLGLGGAPQAGDLFKIVETDQEARQIASKRAQIDREQTNRASKRISLDEIGRRLALGTFKELNLVIKGDVDGSIEALADSLMKLSIETVQVNVIHKAVGQIIESDVLLASASDAIIVGFQVRPSSTARNLAEKEGVQIKSYSIIYEAIDEIKSAIEGMLEPTKEEKILGSVEVRETYKISKIGTIAGSFVTEGMITRNSFIRLIREGIVVYPTKEGVTGEISSLKRFKDDVKEVKKGFECGITIKNYNDVKVGDTIEVYTIEEVKQSLD